MTKEDVIFALTCGVGLNRLTFEDLMQPFRGDPVAGSVTILEHLIADNDYSRIPTGVLAGHRDQILTAVRKHITETKSLAPSAVSELEKWAAAVAS